MQASMSEVVLPLDGRDDEVHHSTEMDQIGSSCRDETQLSSQIDDETLEDVDIVIDHALVQYFGTTLPSATQNEHQPSPPPCVPRDDVPVEQELSKTSEPKSFTIDSVEPNLVSIDRFGPTIESNWDETETDFNNYYLPSYAQEVVITTETNSPHAPEKEPSERVVTAPNDYSLDVIVPEKLGVQGFPFEESLNPLTSAPNPNPLQEEFFDDMDLNRAALKDCRSFYEAQSNELSAEGSPVTVSPGCSSMRIVPISDAMLEVGTQSPPEDIVASVGLGVGKNVIVEMNPTASPDVARVPCSNPVVQPLSPPPSYRQTMAAAYQKTVYDPLSCCGPYGDVVKNKIVLSYSGEGVMSENDSRDSDYGPPKLDAIDDNHASANDQPNDYPPMLEPADPVFTSSGKAAVHVIPSAAGEALESIKKLSLGVVPENGPEILEGCSQDELNECLGKLVPSITPEFSKEIPSGYIVNDMYNVRNITPESSTIATCVDDVGSLPDLLPVTVEPKLYRTFNRANTKKNKSVSVENPSLCSSQAKLVEKVVSLPLPEPANKFEISSNLPESSVRLLVQKPSNARPSNETTIIFTKKDPTTSTALVQKNGPSIGPRGVSLAERIPHQTLSALMHGDGMGRANFKFIQTSAGLGVQKLTLLTSKTSKEKIFLLNPASVKKILAADSESAANHKKLTPLRSASVEKGLLNRALPDTKCAVKPTENNLPTSSNSVLLKENKEDLNASASKGTSKVSGKSSLKVSLSLDLLPSSLIPDAAKKVVCDKNDEPIEKAVTADGEVDPNAIMDAMKVSVPYLFPVTKPEVKKIIKPDVGKMEQLPNSVQEKKKSAAPPVVVKMTSKANRKIFSPVREVEFPLETSVSLKKSDSSLIKTTVTPTMKQGLKGNVSGLVVCHQPSTSDLITNTTNVPAAGKTNNTVMSKVETVVKPERAKDKAGQSVANDSKKKALEPTLMKQLDNASDDLSSFLSSLSGPKDRPKGANNLEKVVHKTGSAQAASTCVADVKSVTKARIGPTNDPIIIPPSAFRKDDPLSLKVGLKPCKFREIKKGELGRQPQISQSTRSFPVRSRSNFLPTSKQTAVPRCESSTTKTCVELQPASISTSENDIVPQEESISDPKEDSLIKTEEKVHPIVELINQLIESNSKSPQIFSDPEKTHPEESQVAKLVDETRVTQEEVDPQKAFAVLKNEQIRAKEDDILVSVVKERTSKLIQNARNLVSDFNVPCSDDENHPSEKSVITEPIRKASNEVQTKNGDRISTAKISVGSKVTKGSFPLKKADPQKASIPEKAVEQRVGATSDKNPSDLPFKKIVSVPPSTDASTGTKDQKEEESKTSPSLALLDKNVSVEHERILQVQASTETPSKTHSLTEVSVPEDSVAKEMESVQTEDPKCSPKTVSASDMVPLLAFQPSKQPSQVIPEQTLTNQLQKGNEVVMTCKTSKELNINEENVVESSSKVIDLPKKLSISNPVTSTPKNTGFPKTPSPSTSTPLTLAKVPSLEEPCSDKPKTSTMNIPVSCGKTLEELKEKKARDMKKPNQLPVTMDVPVGKESEKLKVMKINDSKSSSKTVDSSKKTPPIIIDKSKSTELLTELLINKPACAVSVSKTTGDLISKKAENCKMSIPTDEPSKKAPSSEVKPSKKPQVLPADERQPPTKTNEDSLDDSVKELKGKKGEGRERTPKTAGSSKKAAFSTEKPPTQLIVSIPTVAISNQPRISDVLICAKGPSVGLKNEKAKTAKGSLQTIDLSEKTPSSKGQPSKQTKVSIPETTCEPKTIIIGIPLPACRPSEESDKEKASPLKDSATGLSGKVPSVKDNLLKQQTDLAIDRRTSTRRKSRCEVPISTSDESTVEDEKDGKETSEKVGSLEKHTPSSEKRTEKSIGSNSVDKGNPPTSQQDTSIPLAVVQNVNDGKAKYIEATAVLPENDNHRLDKPFKSQKIPEKIGHRMQTRGSVSAPASCGKGDVETSKNKETGVPVENDFLKADPPLQEPNIPVNGKSSKRPRTRSETSSEKKVHDEVCTEHLEAIPVADDEHASPKIQCSVKKSHGENSADSPASQSTTASVVLSSCTVTEQKQEVDDIPTVNVRTRGKIERKPATVKPIPATPKKGGSKLLGSSKVLESSLLDDLDELDNSSSPSNKNLESKESADVAENNTDIKRGNDDETFLKTPVSTRRSSSHKNNVLGSTETNTISDTEKPLSRKSNSNRTSLCQDPKQLLLPKKNLRVSMKSKKVSKLKKDVKNLVNDVYDFTDDEDQSIKIQTIDHYRKVSGKSTKNIKNSFSHCEMSREPLLSDGENKVSNQARRGRKETLKVFHGQTKRRASPRKSMSEPRKPESKRGKESQLKNAASESTESLLSNCSETVLPAELQENLRNSRNESIRLAKQNRLKKSPARKLITSVDAEEARSPKPSSTRDTRRSSGSRTSSVENLNIADKKDKKEPENVVGSGNRSTVAKAEVEPSIEISTREIRRSSGASSEDSQIIRADKNNSGKKEVVTVASSDSSRKRSSLKKDLIFTDKLSRENISKESTKLPKSHDFKSVNSMNDVCLRTDYDSVCQISTRSKSRESINEDDTTLPRALRNKGILQTSPADASDPKFPKQVEVKSVTKSSEGVHKARHKINRNDDAMQVSKSSNPDPSHCELDTINSLSAMEAVEVVVDQASLNRMITRSSKTTEYEETEHIGQKAISVSDEGKFLPKLRSSVNKRLDVFSKTDQKVVEVETAPKPMVHNNEKISEISPNKVECVTRVITTEKLKKIKKTDSVIIASKDGQFPIDHILEGVTKPITIGTGDAAGKEKHKRAKKGGIADSVNDMILSQPPILSNLDITSRNAEAVSLKTPPMDSTAAQELDNVQPVGAMSQHGEPEGAKSSTRTAQLRSLVVPLDEDGCSASNSIGLLRKKNKKLVVEKKKLAQSAEILDDKPLDGEVVIRKANDAIIKSGNKRSSVNCLVSPVKGEGHRTLVDNDVVSKSGLSLIGESRTVENKRAGQHSDDVGSNEEARSTRRITRSSLSTSSSNLDLKTLESTFKGEQELLSSQQNHLSSSSPDLSLPDKEPSSSKKLTHSKEGLKRISSHNSKSDLVIERSKSDLSSSPENEERTSQFPVHAPPPKNELEGSKISRSTRGRKPKAGSNQSDQLQPVGKSEMEFAQPNPVNSEKEKSVSIEIITPVPLSVEDLPSLGRSMAQGKSKTSTKKDVVSKPSSYCMLGTVDRVKTNTKDVCVISGEVEKLFEEASLDGKEGFDVIVPSPGKSPDSTTQNSSEIIIPVLLAELDDLPNAKISEDAHGVTSTTEFGNVLIPSERKTLILTQGIETSESSTKKEDESVSSTTVDSTKNLESNEVESSSDHLISVVNEEALPSETVKVVDSEKSNPVRNIKIMAKVPKLSSDSGNLVPEHPKKIWRTNPVLNELSTPSETPTIITVGSSEHEVSSVVKPHISDEELKKTPLKKRQVWAYTSSYSNDDGKNKLLCKGSSPVEGDLSVIHSTNDASHPSERPKSLLLVVVGSSVIPPEKEVSQKSNEIICTGKADGTCSPTSLVDRLPHSICNILAAPTDKVVTNEPTAETPPQGAESSEPGLNKTNKKRLVVHNTRSKAKVANMVRRTNKKPRAGMSLRSTNNRLMQKRHLVTRKFRVKMIKKRCKVVMKDVANHKKLKLSYKPKLLGSDKNIVAGDVNHIQLGEGQVNQAMLYNTENITRAASSEVDNVVDSNTISSPSENPTVLHSRLDTNGPVFASSVPKPTKVLEQVEQPAKVSSPASNDKCAELIVDTTDKEIEDEESPPFSPIAADTTKQNDWNSHSNNTRVESSVNPEKKSPAPLPSSFTRRFHDTPLDVPLEDVTYRRSNKIERMRSYSNDEPVRSHSYSSKARLRRKSHPVENIPVDLSNHVKPVFGMKIQPNMPKLDLTGRTAVYHKALDQPPVPYELIPTTHVRPIPTPPPSYVPPHRPVLVHPIKANKLIRPIPTLRVSSPVAPYAPITGQFTPADDMRIELSSRMNVNYSMSAFHSTKRRKSSNTNITELGKVDYNPLLLAHENHYILNAGLSNVIPSLTSTSTYMNSPSSMMKLNKPRSGRGRTDRNSSTLTASTSKSGIMNVRSTPPDSTEDRSRDMILHEAQVQLLLTNPELSISRTAKGGNGPLTTGNRIGSLEARLLETKHAMTVSSGNRGSVLIRNSCRENQKVEIGETIEPLDVVTCELDEGNNTDSSVHVTRINVSGITSKRSPTLRQQTSKKALKEFPVTSEPVQCRVEDALNMKSVKEAIVVEDCTSKENPCENPPTKAASTPRRRISILDAHKSFKNSSTEDISYSPTEVAFYDTNKKSTPPSVVPSEPKERVPDTRPTKTVGKNNMGFPADASEGSIKNIAVAKTVNKKPSVDILPSEKRRSFGPSSISAEPKLGHINESESANIVNPSGIISAKGPNCSKETEERVLLVDGPGSSSNSMTLCKNVCAEDNVSKPRTSELVQPTKSKGEDELETQKKKVGETESTSNTPKTAFPLKSNVIGPETVKSVVEGIVNSIKEQGKVESTAAKKGNKPEKVIAVAVVTHNRMDSVSKFKTDKFPSAQNETRTDNATKPNPDPLIDGRLNEAVIGRKPEAVEKSGITSNPKTDKPPPAQSIERTVTVTKPNPRPITDGKPEAVVKSGITSKPRTDKFPSAQTETRTDNATKPNPDPIIDGRLNEVVIGRKPEAVEKSGITSNPKTDKPPPAQSKERTVTVTKPNPRPITDGKQNEAVTERQPEAVEKSGITSKPRTDTFAPAQSETRTVRVTKPNPRPITDGKRNEAKIELKATVEKSGFTSKPKTEKFINAPLKLKTEEIRKISSEQTTGGKLNQANIEEMTNAVEKTISKPKPDPLKLTHAKPSSETCKLNKTSTGQKPGLVEKSIPKPMTGTPKLTHTHIQLETDKVSNPSSGSLTEGKLNEATIRQKGGVDEKSASKLKINASNVSNPSSGPAADGKNEMANIGPQAEVVQELISKPKTGAAKCEHVHTELRNDKDTNLSSKTRTENLNKTNTNPKAKVDETPIPESKTKEKFNTASTELTGAVVGKCISQCKTVDKPNASNIEPRAKIFEKLVPEPKTDDKVNAAIIKQNAISDNVHREKTVMIPSNVVYTPKLDGRKSITGHVAPNKLSEAITNSRTNDKLGTDVAELKADGSVTRALSMKADDNKLKTVSTDLGAAEVVVNKQKTVAMIETKIINCVDGRAVSCTDKPTTDCPSKLKLAENVSLKRVATEANIEEDAVTFAKVKDVREGPVKNNTALTLPPSHYGNEGQSTGTLSSLKQCPSPPTGFLSSSSVAVGGKEATDHLTSKVVNSPIEVEKHTVPLDNGSLERSKSEDTLSPPAIAEPVQGSSLEPLVDGVPKEQHVTGTRPDSSMCKESKQATRKKSSATEVNKIVALNDPPAFTIAKQEEAKEIICSATVEPIVKKVNVTAIGICATSVSPENQREVKTITIDSAAAEHSKQENVVNSLGTAQEKDDGKLSKDTVDGRSSELKKKEVKPVIEPKIGNCSGKNKDAPIPENVVVTAVVTSKITKSVPDPAVKNITIDSAAAEHSKQENVVNSLGKAQEKDDGKLSKDTVDGRSSELKKKEVKPVIEPKIDNCSGKNKDAPIPENVVVTAVVTSKTTKSIPDPAVKNITIDSAAAEHSKQDVVSSLGAAQEKDDGMPSKGTVDRRSSELKLKEYKPVIDPKIDNCSRKRKDETFPENVVVTDVVTFKITKSVPDSAVKNITIDSAAAEHSKQENVVSSLGTAQEKDDGKLSKDTVDRRSSELKQKEVQPVIEPKIDNCSGKNKDKPVPENVVFTAVVTSKITKSVPDPAVKNITIDSAGAEHSEQENVVSSLGAAQEKDPSKGSVPSKGTVDRRSSELKLKEDRPVIDPKIDNCSRKKKDEAVPDNVFVADVVTSEITKSVPDPAAGEQAKTQDSEVTDSPSNKPLSTANDHIPAQVTVLCNKGAPEGQATLSASCFDDVKSQLDSGVVDDKFALGTDKIKSSRSESNNGKGTSLSPEPSAMHQLSAMPPDENSYSTEEHDPSSSREKSHTVSNVGLSRPHRCAEAVLAPQAHVKKASTEPRNTTDSCELEQVAGVRTKSSESAINTISPLVSLPITNPVVCNPSEELSSSPQLKEKSNAEGFSDSCNHPKPSHRDSRAVAGYSKPTRNTTEDDYAKIQDPSSHTLVDDSVRTVPNPATETCAIVQSTESSLLLPSDPTKDNRVTTSISVTRPERKRKRPAWWSVEEGTVHSKLRKYNATPPAASLIEVDCPRESGEKIIIDTSVPKVEVELLCQSVIRKLQETLGISINQIDLTKLKKYWEEFHSSFSRDLAVRKALDERSNQSNDATRKSPTERLSASDIHARPSTSSDYSATIHSPASFSWTENDDDDKPRGLVAILHERSKLAKTSHLEQPAKRGEKRTVSQAFAQNVYIYKDLRVTGRSTFERTGWSETRPLPPHDVPVPTTPSRPSIRQSHQISYSWILEHLRQRRKRNQHCESNIPVQPCKDFIRPHEECMRPSLKEVYTNFAEEHSSPMVGYSRLSTLHDVPVPASTSSSTTSRIPTVTISSDSEDSNPGNPEDTVSERDEVRRRIRRKSNTPSISSCACPRSGHGSNRTTCPSCRKERYRSSGAFSPIRSSRPPFYTEISHVERQESARVRGKRAATVGGGDDPITITDSEATVRYIKGWLTPTWPSDLDTLNDDPPVTRDSFTSYQEDGSSPHVTVSPCPPLQSSSSTHPPPDTERATGATFQRCLQQKPFSVRGHPEDFNDSVQHDSVISTERQMLSLLSQPGATSDQLRAALPAMMDSIRAAGSRHGRHGAGADPSVRSHGHSGSPSFSSTTDDRDPPEIQPSEAEKQLLAKFLHYWEDLTPEVRDEIKELSRQPSDLPDGPPPKKKKS